MFENYVGIGGLECAEQVSSAAIFGTEVDPRCAPAAQSAVTAEAARQRAERESAARTTTLVLAVGAFALVAFFRR